MPAPPGVDIVITYDEDETDITDHVLYGLTWFEGRMSAQPGAFEMVISDKDQDQNFVTGKRIRVTLDGVPVYGGFITHVSRSIAFPVVDTVNRAVGDVEERRWHLRGLDYNMLYDRLFLRRTTDYLRTIPDAAAGVYDDTLILTLLASYIDKPSWLLQDIEQVGIQDPDVWSWQTQGSSWRSQMADIASLRGQIWYIDATGTQIWKAVESGGANWGFSDNPQNYEGYIGFRELEAEEDASGMVNDAMVWGGDDFTGTNPDGSGGGKTIFSRFEDSGSIAAHGRWQWAEQHFNDSNFANQDLLDMRSQRIVDGPPGASLTFPTSGLKNPAWNMHMTWFHKDVPDADYLKPGQYVSIILDVMGLDLVLPLRAVRMSFPILVPDPLNPMEDPSKTAVKFDGIFAIELSDPMTLWQAIANARKKVFDSLRPKVTTATNSTEQVQKGSLGQFIPTPEPDGSTTVFTIKFGYVKGSTRVYKNGLRLSLGAAAEENDYQETSPEDGEFTLTDPPAGDDKLYVDCVTIDGQV